jgi:putative transposase
VPIISERSGYGALRVGRSSSFGATYFLTLTLRRPATGLDAGAPAVEACWKQLEAEGKWQLRTGVVMPDHLHLVVRLTSDDLSDCVRLLKGRLSPMLRRAGLSWQENYYDRRLRPDDDLMPVFLYVYLNPYEAGLVAPDKAWPAYTCCAEDWRWFGPLMKENLPYPEWLK